MKGNTILRSGTLLTVSDGRVAVIAAVCSVLVTGALILASCSTDGEEEEEKGPTYNKFYGTWIEAVPTSEPASFYEGSVEIGVGHDKQYVNYFKNGAQWYKTDGTKTYYSFTNETYQYKTGDYPNKDDTVYNYTFTDTEITANGITKNYTLTSKSAPVNANLTIEGKFLEWDGKQYINWSRVTKL